jgi:hypothetical protein
MAVRRVDDALSAPLKRSAEVRGQSMG